MSKDRKKLLHDGRDVEYPEIGCTHLKSLWFQVAGTLCNLACHHCFIDCGPKNDSFKFMSLERIKPYLQASIPLGVKEFYFTGGEPFLNPELHDILEETLRYGPVTVLTNATLIDRNSAKRLATIETETRYSLEIRISVDGWTSESNDAVRGKGVFERSMSGLRYLCEYGLLPIITATKVWDDEDDDMALEGFYQLMRTNGADKPRVKILPSLKLGREIKRSHGYTDVEQLSEEMMEGFDSSQLICSSARLVTDKGVWVCPILLASPLAKMGETLGESLGNYQLSHPACYTCYLFGAICANPGSMVNDV